MDRRGTDPSSAAGHWDTFLQREQHELPWLSAPWQMPHHDMCQYGITAPQRKLPGLLDQHSTDWAGQSAEDGQVRKTSAGEYQECKGIYCFGPKKAIALCRVVPRTAQRSATRISCWTCDQHLQTANSSKERKEKTRGVGTQLKPRRICFSLD